MTNLSITPAKLEIQLKPGSSYVQSYIIKNNGDKSVTLYTSIDSWLSKGLDGDVVYTNSLPDIDISFSNSNLKLGQSFVIEPNKSQQLVVKVQTATDTPVGDRYLSLFINQEQSANLSSNSTQLIRLGSHLLISISDSETTTSNFKINNFKINNPFIDCFFSTIKFSGEITNQSDFFNKIDNTILINKSNTIINKLTIFPDNILAHNSRNIRCLNDKSPINCQISSPLWPGFYQATTLNQSINFVVLPYSLIIFLIFIAIITKILYSYSSEK